MIAWFKHLLSLLKCEHQYVFLKVVAEQNLRARFNHRSSVYKCTRCGKCETREGWSKLRNENE